MPWRRTRTKLVAFLGAVVLTGGSWIGYQAWHVYRDLSAASADVEILQTAVLNGQDDVSEVALESLVSHTSDAEDRTGTRTWALLSRLPGIGDDARGVQVASQVLATLSRDGLKPILGSMTDLGSLTPRGGQIPVDTIESLQMPVRHALVAFMRADEQLKGEDSGGYVYQWQRRYRALEQQISEASKALRAAEQAVRIMPGMLGRDGPRRYLVVFQNNAEVRATGGLPGAVAVVEADRGHIELVQQIAASSFGQAPEPVLPLTTAEQAIYGDQLGTYFLDANFTPDFPRSAALWRARYEQQFREIDGVLAVDPVALGYVLGATGPVQAGDLTLTADNVVSTLLNRVYIEIQDPQAQDEVFQEVAKAVFDRVTAGVASSRSLLQALARGADEHRLYVHSFNPVEQAQLSGSEVAGELITDPGAHPQVGLYLNDNTGSKMSYYLRNKVSVKGQKCTDGSQTLSGTARLASLAPADGSLPDSITGGGVYGIPPGSQLVAARIYGPVDGHLSGIALNGDPITTLQLSEQDGRPVATAYIYLEPDTGVDLTWEMVTGPGQTGDVQVSVTPGIDQVLTSFVTPSVC